MTDLQIAKNNLIGHTICLCKDGNCIFSDKRGISPMMEFIADGANLSEYSVADVIVGKAVAMLFVKSGIKSVFAKTLSESAKIVFELFNIPYEYEVLTEKIINRQGNDICPMEKTVANTDNVEEAYILLKEKLELMKNSK